MESTDDDPIEARLVAAQRGVAEDASALYQERRDAAHAALAAGWSKYRIGKTLGVSPTTVESILKTSRRDDA